MSLAAALNSATSGLGVASRGTEVVAGNIANAMTPGYARREAVVTSLTEGGVRLASINRAVTASLVSDGREAGAGFSHARTLAAFYTNLEAVTGIAGSGTTLADKVGALDAALISAAARPDSDVRLAKAADAARAVASGVNEAAALIEEARTAADQGIADDLSRLNSGLREVARLNRAIVVDRAAGRDAGSLMDDRQRLIDQLSEIVPIREVPREAGRVALFTTGGATLLDGTEPIDLTFSPAGRIGPEMQSGTPPVSPLILDGEAVEAPQMPLFAGGSLEARFAIRDRLAPEAQAGLDALARDLVERFADPALDPSLPAGASGLFADRLAATSSPIKAIGLANRLTVASALDDNGATNWRLRDGLGAAAPGDVGRATLLTALSNRLQQPRTAAGLSTASRSAGGLAADMAASVSSGRVEADATLARRGAQADAVTSSLRAEGVDTDAEMRRLLELEQAYAANARVIKAADEMLARILEI